MKKSVKSSLYPCWITCNEKGGFSVWRMTGAENVNVLPPKPIRHRAGEVTYLRAGFVTVENPPVEEGCGYWTVTKVGGGKVEQMVQLCFTEEARKRMFPNLTWESEPVQARVCAYIEID